MSKKTKQKQEAMSEAEYIATFCNKKRIRNRWAVYISPETHKRLQRAVSTFKDYYVTTASMVDAILSHHFDTHKELINRLYAESIEKTFNFYIGEENVADDESNENAMVSSNESDGETSGS